MIEGFTSSLSSDADDTDDVISCEPVGTGSVAAAGSGVIGGYSYFGDMSNPDPQDDSPRSCEGDFSAPAASTTRRRNSPHSAVP